MNWVRMAVKDPKVAQSKSENLKTKELLKRSFSQSCLYSLVANMSCSVFFRLCSLSSKLIKRDHQDPEGKR